MRFPFPIAALFALALSGCAFAPQAVIIKPKIDAPVTTIGQGVSLPMNVIDERPKKTLGTRGVSGVGADLTVDGDLTQIVRASISDGISRQGFLPINTGLKSAPNELRVEIRNLDYTLIKGFWAGTLRVDVGLKANCLSGGSRPYERLFRGEHVESVQVVQSPESNNQYVSSAVGEAVSSLLADQDLMRCLAGSANGVPDKNNISVESQPLVVMPQTQQDQDRAVQTSSVQQSVSSTRSPPSASVQVVTSIPASIVPVTPVAVVIPRSVPVVAAKPSPLMSQGQDGYNAERLAKERSCHSMPIATLLSKGPGFESYTVACTNGDALAVRCEFGNCRILQ